MFRRHAFSNTGKVITVEQKQVYDTSTLSRVDFLWNEAKKQKKELFNGAILNAVSIANNLIECDIREYKYLVAQSSQPDFFNTLKIQPLAVCGLLKCSNGWVIGKRANQNLQYGRKWEFVPSGGLSPTEQKAQSFHSINYVNQILIELNEEIGLSRDSVDQIDVLCIVEDVIDHIFDIVIELDCSHLSLSQITDSHNHFGSSEYEQIDSIMSSSQLELFETTPLARFLFQEFLLSENQNQENLKR